MTVTEMLPKYKSGDTFYFEYGNKIVEIASVYRIPDGGFLYETKNSVYTETELDKLTKLIRVLD